MIEIWDGKAPRIAESAFVHPSAHVIGDVEIGEYTIVFPGAVIRGDVGMIKIGRWVLVEDNCVLHAGSPHEIPTGRYSPLIVGDNVVIGHGAVVHGKRIGNNVLIGTNSCVLEDVEIEEDCLIAAGAVVTATGKVIPARSFLTGVPAKIKGKVPPDQLAWFTDRYEYAVGMVRIMRQAKVM
ncbi:MAG: gamma carbonic anhydrase family protein [Dehalococcoidia bacterium]|nr:gamma carbonic anhydrase family protein [Dehalococcoidia bacterium]